MLKESALEVTLPGECAGHVLMCTFQGPHIELHHNRWWGTLVFII